MWITTVANSSGRLWDATCMWKYSGRLTSKSPRTMFPDSKMRAYFGHICSYRHIFEVLCPLMMAWRCTLSSVDLGLSYVLFFAFSTCISPGLSEGAWSRPFNLSEFSNHLAYLLQVVSTIANLKEDRTSTRQIPGLVFFLVKEKYRF